MAISDASDGNMLKKEVGSEIVDHSILPLVSLIIPIYKVAPYVRKCLSSVVQQTYPNIEVLIINDASPDDSMIVVNRCCSDLKNVQIIDLPENGGLSNARNVGMGVANGKYLFFLDSDDWLAPEAIQLAVEKAEAGEAEVVIIDYYRARADGRFTKAKDRNPYAHADMVVFDPNVYQNALQILNLAQIKLYRKDFIEKNRFKFTENVIYEDIDWTFKVITSAIKVAVVDEPLYFYRTARPGSILSTAGKRHFDVLSQYERVFRFLEENDKDHFFYTIYSYAINAIFSVLLENKRIPAQYSEEFFLKAKAIFRAAKCERQFDVELYGRSWFEKALLNDNFSSTVHLYNKRKKKIRREKSKFWKWIRSLFIYKVIFVYPVSAGNFLQKKFGLLFRKISFSLRRIIHALPRKNQVVFESYWGEQFSDSPKYLYQYIKNHYPDVKCFYSLNSDLRYCVPKGDFLKRGSLKYHLKLANSKIFVNNNNFVPSFKKPDNSIFIQTFHGVPIKYLGTDMIGFEDGGKTNWASLVRRCLQWDYVITAGAHHTEALRGAFQSEAKFVEVGSPRTDCLQDDKFKSEMRAHIREYFGLPEECRILLYAPTWRQASAQVFLRQDQLEKIAQHAGDDVYVLARQHHMSNNRIKGSSKVIDASGYPDSQAICAGADLLITDYSSIVFDFALTGNPAVFYIRDYDEYRSARGLYIDMQNEFKGLVFRDYDSLLLAVGNLFHDQSASKVVNSIIRDGFLEGETDKSCRYVVENLIIPHLCPDGV